jgi:hypothetical protein
MWTKYFSLFTVITSKGLKTLESQPQEVLIGGDQLWMWGLQRESG